MKTLKFSNNDEMPALGLGTWKSAKGDVYKAVRTAINLGYKHFDCAMVYGNEKEIGQAFADAFVTNEVTREELWITSKVWNNTHRTEQIEPALKSTLADLQLDYLDLYLIHWPVVLKDDSMYPVTGDDLVSLTVAPLAATWEGMIGVKNSGLTKHIGVSNFSISKLDNIIAETGVVPEVNQVEMHPFLQQATLKAYCDEKGIFMTAYAPLGSADRPANRISEGEPQLFENESMKNIASEQGCTVAQVMLSWAVCRGTSVIPKSVNEGRLKENLAAADIELTAAQMATMDKVNTDFRFITGDFWCLKGSDYTVEGIWA